MSRMQNALVKNSCSWFNVIRWTVEIRNHRYPKSAWVNEWTSTQSGILRLLNDISVCCSGSETILKDGNGDCLCSVSWASVFIPTIKETVSSQFFEDTWELSVSRNHALERITRKVESIHFVLRYYCSETHSREDKVPPVISHSIHLAAGLPSSRHMLARDVFKMFLWLVLRILMWTFIGNDGSEREGALWENYREGGEVLQTGKVRVLSEDRRLKSETLWVCGGF